MKHAFQVSTLAITALVLLTPIASAQDEQPESSATDALATHQHEDEPSSIVGSVFHPPTAGPHVSVRGNYRLQFKTDFDGEPGDFSVNRGIFGVDIAGSINEELSYSLDFQVEFSSYDFGGATSLVPGSSDPLSDALTFTFTPAFRYAIDDEWAVHGGAALIISGETDAQVDDSIRGTLFGGVERRFSEKLTVSLLIVVWSRLEDDAQIFPILGVSWQINELMRLQTRGLGAEFISDLGNGWSLGARAAYEYREFRLTDDSSAPLPEGVLRDTGIITSLELAYKPSPDVVLAVEVGGVFAQELEFLDRGGSAISTTDSDPALFVGIRASIAF